MPPKSKTDIVYKCTACAKNIVTSYHGFLHPLLKVLVCRKCHSSYGTGDFNTFEDGVDENGDDNYCRWCVDGGDLCICGNTEKREPNKRCHYTFCTDCIKRNCPEDDVLTLDEIPSDWKWSCFVCDTRKLKKLRQEAQIAILALSGRDLKRSPSIVTSEKVPASTTNGDHREEVNAGAAKKRKLDNGSVSRDLPESSNREASRETGKDSTKGTGKDSTKETGKDSAKESTKTSTRQSDKDATKEVTKESAKEVAKDSTKDTVKGPVKEKTRESNKESSRDTTRESVKESAKESTKELSREPEACLMPPLEKPKPPKTSLRQLQTPGSSLSKSHNTSSPIDARGQKPARDRPVPSKTISSSSATNVPSSTNSTETQPKPKQSSSVFIASDNNSIKVPAKVSSMPPFSKLRPTSKQLKPNNEQIIPSTKVQLNESDLKKRLEVYGTVKDKCVKEINIKFQNILEMFETKEEDARLILKSEIEELSQPLQEFQTMLLNLKSLYHSQN